MDDGEREGGAPVLQRHSCRAGDAERAPVRMRGACAEVGASRHLRRQSVAHFHSPASPSTNQGIARS
jgi:hypothetical protein